MLMSYDHEKALYGVSTIAGGVTSALGAIVTEGEARWLYVALSVSIFTAAFLAIVFKRADESMRVVIGRCGLTIIGGIFGTRYLLHSGTLKIVNDDMILLGSQVAAVTIASFLVGFPLLQIVNKNGKGIADRIFSQWAGKQDPDGK